MQSQKILVLKLMQMGTKARRTEDSASVRQAFCVFVPRRSSKNERGEFGHPKAAPANVLEGNFYYKLPVIFPPKRE